MSPRASLLSPIVLLALLAAACTGAAADSTPSPAGTTETPTPVVTGPPGAAVYLYANAGVTATLQLEQGTGTLQVVNSTGRSLSRPDFYILDARDGSRIEGRVAGSAPIRNGDTKTFDVSFSLELKNIGLVVLLMGSDNYGAFAPQ